jgi:hypothetical protein
MEIIMQKTTGILVTLITAAGLGPLSAIAPSALAQDMSAQATYADIEKTLGTVPSFFKMFPEAGIAGAWAEFKSVQLNPKTKLDGKGADRPCDLGPDPLPVLHLFPYRGGQSQWRGR